MNAELNLNQILSQVKRLNKVEQKALLEKIASWVSKKGPKSDKVKLSDISGIGAALWNKTNIDEYVDGERQW